MPASLHLATLDYRVRKEGGKGEGVKEASKSKWQAIKSDIY